MYVCVPVAIIPDYKATNECMHTQEKGVKDYQCLPSRNVCNKSLLMHRV